MPTSVRRPWSTQYKEDYNARTAGTRPKSAKCKLTKRPEVVRGFRPAATQLCSPEIASKLYPSQIAAQQMYTQQNLMYPPQMINTYSGHYHCLEDPYSDGNPQNLPIQNDLSPRYEVEPVIPEPVDLRSETPQPDLHWICWPEPKVSESKPKRPNTSLGIHRPAGQTKDQTNTRNANLPHTGEALTYEPKIHSWTNASNENERKTIDMYTTLQRSQTMYEPTPMRMTSISINDPPVRDTYTRYGNKRPSYAVDPTSLYNQAHFPYHQPGGAGVREDQVLQGMSRHMDGMHPLSNSYDYSFNKYPLHNRSRRPVSQCDDYVHERSMFMKTTPNCVGHFIIHPDWVSERSGLRRSKTMVQPNRIKNGGFRY